MSVTTVTGLVIKQSEYGEANRMITVFTKEYGIISAAVYGARSMKSEKAAACRLLCFSQMELSRAGGGIYTVSAAEQKESFYPICEDIEKLSLCVYLCELTYTALGKENRDEDALSLLLNTLYALAYRDIPIKKAKCVYELRLMSIAGYRPSLGCCVRCGALCGIVAFSPREGGLICDSCKKNDIPISRTEAQAMQHIISADIKKVFSFSLSDAAAERLGKICEEYVKVHTDAELASLVYLKKILL